MRRRASFLISIPVAVAGSLLAHQVSYVLQASDGAARARLLAATGHGYLTRVPLLAGVLIAVALGGLIREAAIRWKGTGRTGPIWPIALIPPLAFLVQEHLERLLHDGTFPWHLAAQPAFLRGLALQIPFALLALGLATVIAGTVRRVVDAIREPVRRATPQWQGPSIARDGRSTRAPDLPRQLGTSPSASHLRPLRRRVHRDLPGARRLGVLAHPALDGRGSIGPVRQGRWTRPDPAALRLT